MPGVSYDAIVVGAGAAGGWAAKQLCEAGLDVLLVDAGRAIDPERDYPLPAPPARPLRSRLRALLGDQRIQMRCAAFNERSRRFFVSDRENPYDTPADAPFNWFRGRQVGGRLHTWARVIPRLSDYELRAADLDGQGVSWPLSYRELAAHYDQVEDFLGAYGDADGLPQVPDGRYVRPAVMTEAEKEFRAAVHGARGDVRVIGARMAAPAARCVPATILAAQRTGRLELRPHCVVREVLVDPRHQRAIGVSAVEPFSRTTTVLHARLVILCASTIETLRILLNSGLSGSGLGNSSGRLGRFLMDSVVSGAGGPHPGSAEETGPRDSYDLGRLTGFQIPRFHNLEGSAGPGDFYRGYGIQGGMCRETASWYMLAQGEMLARAENRVTLHPRLSDRHGMPVAHIECRPGANELAMASDQQGTLRALAAAAGLQPRTPPSGRRLEALAFSLWRGRLTLASGAFLPGSAIHEVGGAGMGTDPKDSVLDPFNRLWDADNVLVTDGACFPSGCWQNVTLTIMALTARASDHIVTEYAAGRV